MAAVPLEVTTCFMQALLYGAYAVSSFHCLRWLVFDTDGRKFRSNIHWPMTMVAVALFTLMTANIALVFQLMLYALEGQSSSSGYSTSFVAASGIGAAVHLIVDGVLIYRCWMIHRNAWLTVIIPLASLWTINLIAAIIGLVVLASNQGLWPSSQQQNSVIFKDSIIVNMIFFLSEIAINVYATSAIVYQIVRVTRWDGRRNSGSLYKIGLILAESGILFTITCVLSLCLKVMAMAINKLLFAAIIMNIINFNIAGFTFNIIFIRLYKEKPQSNESSEGSQDENKTTVLLTTIQLGASTQGVGQGTRV